MPAFDNTAVAAKLALYADLLELTGEDTYRLLAYRKAATAIRSWPEQVAALANEGRLTEVTSVGSKLAATIEEIVQRGSFDALDAICSTTPASLAEVMRVPGIGPKRAAQLHEKLGVTSIDELEAALDQGHVERLGGFGAKTAAKIAASLESHRRHAERIPISVAWPLAEQLVRDVAALPSVIGAAIAGSVRRRAETVGNVDIVAASADPAAAAQEVGGLPAVESVIEANGGDIAVELHDGAVVNVHVVEPGQFAVARRYWTGSVEHNLAVAALAAERGFEITPAAVYRAGVSLSFADEAALFARIGLLDVPPEAREGTETLEMAVRGEFPTLVTLDDVRGDLQSHSTYTDGKGSLADNRAVAASLGYEYIAATDHAYALRMVGGLDIADLERQWAEIDELNSQDGGPRILKGIELNIAEDGSLDYDDDVLARFDIALASLHSGWDQDEATITRRLLAAIEHPLVDVIAHPTGRVIGRRDPLKLDMHAVLEAAGETGTIMEINSYPDRLDLSAEHIRLARRFGVRFSLGTDAHAPDQLQHMHYGVAQARRGLVTADELINAQQWPVARRWLKRSKYLD